MTQEKNDAFSELLKVFDELKLTSIHERRMACKPLHDFFQILLKEVGVALLGLDKNSLSVYHLKTRWENIKIHLSYVEDPKAWDGLVNEMNNIRQRVEHDDYYDPKPGDLKKIREKLPEFKEWIFRVGRRYYEKSKNMTFKQLFYRMLAHHTREASGLIQDYGEKTPHVAKSDYSIFTGKESYAELKELVKVSEKRLDSVSEAEEVQHSDLQNLINLIKIISRIKGKEETLLRYSVCPKCGGKIVESQRQFGGSEYHPEPDGFVYRIGCEKCDYELNRETIYI